MWIGFEYKKTAILKRFKKLPLIVNTEVGLLMHVQNLKT